MQDYDASFPAGALQSYTVHGGESLAEVADAMYGNRVMTQRFLLKSGR